MFILFNDSLVISICSKLGIITIPTPPMIGWDQATIAWIQSYYKQVQNCNSVRDILQPLDAILGFIGLIIIAYGLFSSDKPTAPAEEEQEKAKKVVYIRCQNCKTENEEDAGYCKKCGKKLY
jgi:hypothetical protein